MKLKKFLYKKVFSTNDIALKKIKKGFENGIILSDEQKKGRGKYGNKWISIKGNLFTTVFFKINNKIKLEKILKFNCSLVKKTLRQVLNKKINIKPPNDIMINKEKVSGILQEIINYKNNKYLIVGIGINIVASPKIDNYKCSYINNFHNKFISRDKVFYLLKDMYEKNLRNIQCI